jgi:hypothetical protein
MLRSDYHTRLRLLDMKIAKLKSEGMSVTEVSSFAVKSRQDIARSIRLRQNPGAMVTLELRDWKQYGFGGRSKTNLCNRANSPAETWNSFLGPSKIERSGHSMDEYLIRSAPKASEGVDEAVLRAGRYLRYGGLIMIVIGTEISAYDILSAAPQDRGRVASEEVGATVGSWLLSGAVTAVAILAIPATGGLSLIAIGAIGVGGGILGSIGGTLLADQIYYASAYDVPGIQRTGVIEPYMIQRGMPLPPLACPRCHPLR